MAKAACLPESSSMYVALGQEWGQEFPLPTVCGGGSQEFRGRSVCFVGRVFLGRRWHHRCHRPGRPGLSQRQEGMKRALGQVCLTWSRGQGHV